METKTTHTSTESGGSFLGHLWSSVSAMVILIVICCGLYPFLVWGIAQVVFPHQANGSLIDKDGKPTKDADKAVGSELLGQAFTAPGYFHPRPSAAGNSAGTSFSSTGGYDPTSSGGSNYGPINDQFLNGATATPTTQPTTQPADATTTAPTTGPTTQPAEALTYDGVRLRTLHYAVDNGLTFKLHVGGAEVPAKQFQDSSGNWNDVALVDAFPHPANDADGRAVLTVDDFRDPAGHPIQIPADAVTASGSGLDPHISPANAALQAPRIAAARKVSVQQVTALIDQYTDGPTFGLLGDPGVNVLKLNIAIDAKYPVPAK